ncbi:MULTISPECIES: sensor domain-containing diguanylate cyclase [Halomonadaceae]|uniref:sensor domain-containing diguanylate cyclase n=1 Tax=Halomonadaceae TaxID=28256 RepID=UPI0004E37BB9|nr:diguanylate cyclase [Halomonas sp. KO116]AJY49392.1 diguanylate cyclase with PAS/PAC sensor [Halomonas sp. KO116]
MPLRRLHTRLLLAVSIPLILVSTTLLPVLHVHMETRLNSLSAEADALLKVGQEALTRDINESLNYALAIAEMPGLRRYLAAQSLTTLTDQQYSLSDLSQLSNFLTTLISHNSRYTKLVLIDNQGREVLRAPRSIETGPRISGNLHVNTDYFIEASKLLPRDLYISPPGHNLQFELFGRDVIPVVNVSTPVFDATGERRGVVLLSLNWDYLTDALRQAMLLDQNANTLLVDAQGKWLLNEGIESIDTASFGGNFAALSPHYWQAMQQRSEGDVIVDNHLLRFQTEDIRTQRYRSLAGTIYSDNASHPWKLGVTLPRPTWFSLFKEEATVLWFLLLTYGVTVAFGLFWAFSSQRQRELRQAAQRHAYEVSDLYENAPCGYHSIDKSGLVVKMNRTELAWLGYSAKEVIGHINYRELITPETREQFEKAFQNVKDNQPGSAECSLLTRNGEPRHVMIQGSAYTRNGRFVHSRAMVFDLTERKQLEEKLRAQAMTDPLTGVFNRRYLQAQATIEMSRARRQNHPIALITIDIDHFKHINDEYGHDIGDEILKNFTQIVSDLLRQEDLLCRVGGEEFAVLLPNTAIEQAQQVAERIRASIEEATTLVEYEGTQQALKITASLGVTSVRDQEKSLKPALKRADIGLYEAKENGRNQFIIHTQ